MQSPDRLLQRLLRELRPALAEQGFRRKSQNFIAESAECWGVINFQKSLYSSTGQKKFTVNLAIASKRVLRFYGEPSDRAPRYYACHWDIRIGQLIPGNLDRWWTLSDEQSFDAVAPEIMDFILRLAVPIIRDHLSEAGLLKLWGSKNPGRFEYPTLKHKAILLCERGEFDMLPHIFDRIREICRGGAAEAGAEEHIATVKHRYPVVQ